MQKQHVYLQSVYQDALVKFSTTNMYQGNFVVIEKSYLGELADWHCDTIIEFWIWLLVISQRIQPVVLEVPSLLDFQPHLRFILVDLCKRIDLSLHLAIEVALELLYSVYVYGFLWTKLQFSKIKNAVWHFDSFFQKELNLTKSFQKW